MDPLNIAVFAVFMSIGLVLFALLAYAVKRREANRPIGGPSMQITLPEPGPIAKKFSLIWKVLLCVVLLLAVGAAEFDSMILFWTTISVLVLTVAALWVARIARLAGK